MKNYWIILCNPLTWYEETDLYQVNDLLIDLDEDFWKINSKTVYPNIKIGDEGIIKVGIDKRTKVDRYNPNKRIIEDKLKPGIYATFEVIKNKEINDCRRQYKNIFGKCESFAYIKIIHNFFKDEIIQKDKAIEILGKKTFNTRTSKKISQKQYEDILLKSGL